LFGHFGKRTAMYEHPNIFPAIEDSPDCLNLYSSIWSVPRTRSQLQEEALHEIWKQSVAKTNEKEVPYFPSSFT